MGVKTDFANSAGGLKNAEIKGIKKNGVHSINLLYLFCGR
jgi:hypothetical protein